MDLGLVHRLQTGELGVRSLHGVNAHVVAFLSRGTRKDLKLAFDQLASH